MWVNLIYLVSLQFRFGSLQMRNNNASFLTHSANASLTVMTPPLTPPTIVGVANFYNSGDLVDINCTSFESKPTANLTWNVNDQPVII